MTSWPTRSASISTLGDTATRSFRPPVNTSTVPSSKVCRNTPYPLGGCASRSTSSLSAMTWSRASRRVPVSFSFRSVSVATLLWASASRSSSTRR